MLKQSNWTKEKPYCIYKHTSPSGNVYIGQTGHEYLSMRFGVGGVGYKLCPVFWQAIQKYGWDNIKHEILFEELTKVEADRIEIELIAEYKAKHCSYNLADGAGGLGISHKLSAEHRAKISATKKGNSPNPMKGKKHSEQSRANMSAAHKGKPLSKIHAQHISEANRGKKHSEEWKQRISESRLKSPKCRGKIWIRRGDEQKTINPTEYEQYAIDGWTKGRIPLSAKSIEKMKITKSMNGNGSSCKPMARDMGCTAHK